ncbi:MAG TPA: septal ring lytic transglycosylase RlpA family protein [Methylomirabilota bacterium]|jgi:rare lipoprotein A
MSGSPGPATRRGEELAALSLLLIVAVCGCAVRPPPAADATVVTRRAAARPRVEVGLASWYGEPHDGRPTASGEIFDMTQLTAAHRTLPLGTRLRVVNLENGRAVRVRVNDRGPYVAGRILDLSRRAADVLDMVEQGITRVRLEIVEG